MIDLFLLMATLFGAVLAQSPGDAVTSFPTMYPDPDGLLSSVCQICGSFPPNICCCWVSGHTQSSFTVLRIEQVFQFNQGVQEALAAWPRHVDDFPNIHVDPRLIQTSPIGVDDFALQRMSLGEGEPCEAVIGQWNEDTYMPGDRTSPSQGKRDGADPSSFVCKNCKKPFVRQCDLTRHQKIHRSRDGGERPHSCLECGMGFNYPKDLRRHEKIHHKEDQPGHPWICRHAGCENKPFGRKDNLARHIKKKHGSDTNSTYSTSFSADWF